MSGTINGSNDSNKSRVDAWNQKYDEEAEHLFRGQESARKAVRDLGTEHAAYLKARGKVDELGVDELEVAVEEKAKADMTQTEKAKDKKRNEEVKAKEEKRKEAGGKADEEKTEQKANKGKWWNFLDGRMSRLGFHNDEE